MSIAARRSASRCVKWVSLCALFPTVTMPAPAPVEAFSGLPAFTRVALSPDGTMLAMDAPTGSDYHVVMLRIADGKRLRAVSVDSNNKLRDLRWADDRTLLVELTVTKRVMSDSHARSMFELQRTIAVNVEGGDPRMLLMRDGNLVNVTGASMESLRGREPGKVTMSTLDFSEARHRGQTGTKLHDERRDSGWTQALFEVDLKSGRGIKVETGTTYTEDWVVGREGHVVARGDWNSDEDLYTVHAKNGDGWREIHRFENGESPWLPGVTADGKAVVAITENGGDLRKAWALPLDGGPPRVLYEDAEADVTSVEVDPYTQVVEAYFANDVDGGMQWVDEKRAAQARAIVRSFPGKRVVIEQRSTDGKKVLVKVDASSEPPIYYLVDFHRGAADIVGEVYPALVGVKLGAVKFIHYAARDGTSIPAIVTMPPDAAADAKRLPLVVLPHGGPEANDSDEFDWLSQFLASRGYVVLQPQFRGSTGFGKGFREAGRGQWGRLMQDDVSDGVRHLVTTEVADPTRVCIAGASYGGYAALAGAAFTPELYTCAASISGVSDLPAMLGEVRRRYGKDADSFDYWSEHIGAPDDPHVISRSPARSAETVRAPILLLHGIDDTVVPIVQSELMDKALTAARKPHRFVRLPGEDHWMSRMATRHQILIELEKFLAEHLAP